MRATVLRALLVVWLLIQGARLLLEPTRHASMVTAGLAQVFMAGALSALIACDIAKKRRKRTRK